MPEFMNDPLFELIGKTFTLLSMLEVAAILLLTIVVLMITQHFLERFVFQKIELSQKHISIANRVIGGAILVLGLAAAIETIIPQAELLNRINLAFNYKLFTLDDKAVSLYALLKLIILLVLFALGSRFFRDVVLKRFFQYMQTDAGVQYTFSRVIHYLIMVSGVVIGFQSIGFNLSGLAVIFGFLSVGIGFGLQNVTSNFVAGLILLFERPILVGDRVLVGDIEGDVDEIKIRATRIQTTDNISIIVPNSEFVSQNVINYSHGDSRIRMNIDVGVSYSSNLDTVIRSLKEIAQDQPEVLPEPAPDVLLTSFGDSSWDMRLRVWIIDPKRHPTVRSNINCAIVHKFRENGIEIPFPQRDLNFRNPLHMDGDVKNGQAASDS